MKRKIYKALSIVLTLMIVFSACLCVFNTVSAATEKTYFVSSTGKDTNNGLQASRAFKTVAKAIETANNAGLGAGDTVTVKVLNTTAVAWLAEDSWLPEYTFDLIVTSNSASGDAVIGNGSTVNMGGDVLFTNIKVNFGSNYTELCANGHNLEFGTGAVLAGNAAMSGFSTGAYSGAKKATYDQPITIVNTLPIKYFGLVANYSGCTFNEDINVSYSGSESPVFYVSSQDGTTKINKALNVNIKSANGVTFKKKAAAANFAFGEEGYMQVLNATATELTDDSFPTEIEDAKLWVLNNKLRAGDLIELTDTKGKFKVNTAVYQNVKATLVSDSNTVINEADGFLTLPAGVYNITAEKIPQTGTYYVKKNGTGDGSSVESPLGDVGTALNKAITDGYIINDTVKVMLIGDSVDMGSMPNYAFDLEIDSNDPASRTRLVAGGVVANNASGLTTYKNVEVYREGDWKAQQLQSSNVIFSKESKFSGSFVSLVFGTGQGGGASEQVAGQKVVYAASAAPYAIYLSNWSWASRTYNDVVDFEFDVPGGSSSVYLNAAYGGSANGTTTYKKAVNINIKNAKGLTFVNLDNITYEAGLQIINSAADALSNTEGELSKVPADKLYLINNVSGNNNIIEFTDTVGKYKVNLDNPEHVLVAKNVATGVETTYDGTSGFITLTPAAYELRIDRDPVYMDYYVDPENGVEVVAGTRPEGVGSKQNPVKTYADATRLIAQDGLAEIDVATIYIPSGQTAEWGSSPAVFTCQLIINSTMEGDPGTLQNYGGISLTGNTTLRNVNLKQTYQWAGLRLADYNFTVEKDATASVYYCYIWNTGYGVKHTKDMNIRIEGTFSTNSIAMGAEYHSHTCTGDINIYYDSETSSASLAFGGGTDASTNNIYEGNINITIKNATSFSLSNRTSGADIKGSLQVLVDDAVKLPYSVKTNFENFEVEGGKWYITNQATDDDFVDFTAEKGKFAIKGGKTAYSRQFEKDQVKHTGGLVDLSAAPGSYVVSDKNIDPLTDDSHKMLYFRLAGGSHNLSTRAKVTPGETYRFEYSIFTSLYEDSAPAIRDDGDRGTTCEVEVISEEKIGNYYRIVAQGTIPEDYNHGSTACFGVNLSAYSEGVIFDRTVYNVNDPDKKDCFEGNPIFHDGLDYVTLDQTKWWGKILDAAGMVSWTNGFEELEVMNFSEDFIAYLIALNNPNDGKWWNDKDIIEEEVFATYAKARGTFTDQNGNGISGTEFVLVSDEKTYKSTSNAKGKFDFGTILTGFYDLYIMKNGEKLETGFSSYIAQDDVVEFTVVTDTSGIVTDSGDNGGMDYNNNSYDVQYNVYEDTNITETENSTPSGNLQGTVYTAALETVPNLKIVLEGIGEVITDENGRFGFADIPVGEYELYAVNSDGSKYVFKTYSIKEGVSLDVKLKYAPALNSDSDASNNLVIYVVIAAVLALLVVAGLVFFLIFKKKKIEQV